MFDVYEKFSDSETGNRRPDVIYLGAADVCERRYKPVSADATVRELRLRDCECLLFVANLIGKDVACIKHSHLAD